MKQLFWQRDGVFEPETHVETYTTGIKWISIISNLLSVQHMHFTECKIIQDPDVAPAFFAAIEQNRGFVWIFYTSRDAELEKLDGSSNNSKINWFINKTILLWINFSSTLCHANCSSAAHLNHFDSRQCSGRLA